MKGPGADEHYWKALSAGRLEMQQCSGCRRWNWPAVWRCGECGCWEHEWHEVPLQGSIFTWTRSWYDFGAPREFGLPFVTVVVTLDGADHRRVLGTLVGDGQHVHIGMTVVGQIGKVTIDGDELPTLQWRIVGPPQSSTQRSHAETQR